MSHQQAPQSCSQGRVAPDDSVHERVYAKLKSSGQPGWGGSSFPDREKGWIEALELLLADSRFPRSGAAVLEAGCGTGVVSRLLARRGYLVSGVDISVTAVEWARELALEDGVEVAFCQGNVCDLHMFGSGEFDAVIDGACFHCVIGANRAKFLAEVSRVLKPGGIFFVSSMIGDPNETALQASQTLEYDRVSRCQLRAGAPYRFMAEKEFLLRELQTSGFEVVHERVKQNPWWEHLYALAVKRANGGQA